jgi:hypothetical protein
MTKPLNRNKNNVVIVPIASAANGEKKTTARPKETLEQKQKREALYNAQLESGIDEETFRSLPPDIQQELRKNKKTKFEDGFSKRATIHSSSPSSNTTKSIASFFTKKKKKN